jgi:hypothetical protein
MKNSVEERRRRKKMCKWDKKYDRNISSSSSSSRCRIRPMI